MFATVGLIRERRIDVAVAQYERACLERRPDNIGNELRAAIYDAIPSGYTSVTDEAALLLDDYRWDNSDLAVSVNLGSSENKGVVSFNISIFHFLPKPT